MKERGFVLLAVLWVLVVAGALALAAGAEARLTTQATANRVALTRARWAAEACLAIAEERGSQDSVALGGEISCSVRVEDVGSRYPLARLDSTRWTRLLKAVGVFRLRADTLGGRLAAAQHAGRLEHVEQLADRAWLTVTEQELLSEVVTADGPGTVNVNAAPLPVLVALPGLGNRAAQAFLRRRERGPPIRELSDVLADLHAAARDSLLAAYADLVALTTTRTTLIRLDARGWVGSRNPGVTLEVFAVPTAERLAIVGRRLR